MTGLGKVRETGERMHVANETIRIPRDRRAVKRVAKLARIVAPDQDVPSLRVAVRITERGERDSVFGAPTAVIDLRRGVIKKVGRKVFVPVRVVEEAVGLNAARIDAQFHPDALVIAGV